LSEEEKKEKWKPNIVVHAPKLLHHQFGMDLGGENISEIFINEVSVVCQVPKEELEKIITNAMAEAFNKAKLIVPRSITVAGTVRYQGKIKSFHLDELYFGLKKKKDRIKVEFN
jgi:hypothetical protein